MSEQKLWTKNSKKASTRNIERDIESTYVQYNNERRR